jgi:hypothetical protein
MAVLALEDVVKQLQVNKRSTDDVRKVLTDFILMTKRNMLDQLESDRESKKIVKDASKAGGQPVKARDKRGGMNVIALGSMGLAGLTKGLTAAVGTITAGVAALTLGIVAVEEGFRPLFGFEKKALTKIKGMTQFPTWISNSVMRLRTAALAIFGLTPGNMPIRGADGKMMKAVPISTQIANKLASMKVAFLNQFGIGADGKNVPRQGPKGKLTAQPVVIRAIRAITRILAPLTNLVAGVTTWFAGTGSGIVKWIGKFIGKGGAKVFRLFGKFFWPLTILMSLFDGFTAYKEKEGTGYEKFAAGIGGFVGSLVGGIFDLAKGAVNWLLKKIIPGAVDADGNWDESTIIGGWLKTFEDFSFSKTIQGMIEALFAMPRKAIDWIKDLFKDPGPALLVLLEKIFGVAFSMADILFLPMRLAIDWIRKKLGWAETDAPVFSIKDFVFDMFHDVMKWFKSIGPRMKYAFDEWWMNAKFNMAVGFLSLSEFFDELPKRIELMAKQKLYAGSWDQWARDELVKLDATNPETVRLTNLIRAEQARQQAVFDKNRVDQPGTIVTDASSSNTNVINLSTQGANVGVLDGLD